MEEGQRLVNIALSFDKAIRLNPCCNGRGSKTVSLLLVTNGSVLILVVMEEGQRR